MGQFNVALGPVGGGIFLAILRIGFPVGLGVASFTVVKNEKLVVLDDVIQWIDPEGFIFRAYPGSG